ncbi:hypothetical protein [Aureivirga marina]|uniref:hypothetical protein n=1 Tax=Aureivirga marina TaxID=1182451 RepID=UPI0018CA1DB4|nr:hypothetical protein [Aureivirga marina]
MNCNKKKFLASLAIVIFAFLSQNSFAQQKEESSAKGFNFEANADYFFTDTKYSDAFTPNSKTKHGMVGLTYYFGKVDNSKGPLALATFFDRASGIHASFGLGKFESSGEKLDLNTINFAGNYVHKSSGWLANAYYTKTKVKSNPETTTNTYAITAGKYIAENSTLNLGYKKVDADFRSSNTFTLSNFHAQDLGNGSYFDGGIAISFIDFEDFKNAFEFNLETTYYFTKAFGLGLVGTFTTGSEISSFRYGVNAEWFMLENLSINANYNRINSDNKNVIPDFNNNDLSAGLKYRF